MKWSQTTLIVALPVVLILLLAASTYQVAFNQVAVKVRFDEGEVIREPGLRLKWPWPIEHVQHYDQRLQTLDTPETEIKTIDGKNVIVGAYALWTIEDPLQFYRRVRTVDEAEKQMRSRISQAQAAVIGQSNLSDFVNLDAALVEQKYDALLERMRETVAPGLRADYGIHVAELGLRRISLPRETTQEVFNSMRAERNKLAARFREEGKSQAEGIKARANSEAKQILEFASSKAQEIKSAGVQASTRIYEQIAAEDAEFFEWLRWLDALKASLAQKTTIFLDQNSPLFGPFVNPPAVPPAAGAATAAGAH